MGVRTGSRDVRHERIPDLSVVWSALTVGAGVCANGRPGSTRGRDRPHAIATRPGAQRGVATVLARGVARVGTAFRGDWRAGVGVKRDPPWFVYIVRCRDGTLYTG